MTSKLVSRVQLAPRTFHLLPMSERERERERVHIALHVSICVYTITVIRVIWERDTCNISNLLSLLQHTPRE